MRPDRVRCSVGLMARTTSQGDVNRVARSLPAIVIGLLVLLSGHLGSVPIAAAAEPPNGGGTTTISDAQTWDQPHAFNGTVIISAGGSLAVTSEITVAEGSTIIVESGGSLDVMVGGVLDAVQPPSSLLWLGYSDDVNRSSLRLPTEDVTGPFDVTLHSMYDQSLFGFASHLSDGTTQNMTGPEHTISFGVGADDEWISFTGYSFGTLAFDRITIDPVVGSNSTYMPADLDHRNWRLAGATGFSIDVAGDMLLNGGVVNGADVTVSGELQMLGGEFNRSGPITVTEAGSLNLTAGTIDGSRTDHDIRAGVQSRLVISESLGTSGGMIDVYERVIVDQKIQFAAVGVSYRITGLGPYNRSSNPTISGLDGLSPVDSGGERTIEVRYPNGTIWTENATIETLAYRTAWNPKSGTIEDYRGTEPLSFAQTHVYAGPTPHLTIISVEPALMNGEVGFSLQVNVTIHNDGGAGAHVALNCTMGENDSAADVGGFPDLIIEAESSASVTFRWAAPVPGSHALTCSVLTPTQLVDETVWGGAALTSDEVEWKEVSDQSSGALGFLAAVFVGLIFIILAFLQMQKRSDEVADAAAETSSDSRTAEADSGDSDEAADGSAADLGNESKHRDA